MASETINIKRQLTYREEARMPHKVTQRKRDFLAQQALLARIAKAGGFDPYTASLPKLGFAFKPKGGFASAMACMDGGMKRTSVADSRPPEVRLAAPLLDEEPEVALDRTVRIIKKTGVELVSCHENCGAGKILATRMSRKSGDLAARQFAGAAVGRVSGVRVVESPLDRPEYHPEVAVYLAAMPLAPWLVVGDNSQPQLPEGFVLSTWVMTDAELQVQVETAIRIALGPHGNGRLFNEERPLYLVPVASTFEEFDRLDEVANWFADAANVKYGDKIWVDGFVWKGKTK